MITSALKLYITTGTIFFIGDALWILLVMNQKFIPQISHLMTKNAQGSFIINYYAGLIAYLVLTFGLTYFVTYPLYNASSQKIFTQGLLMGFCIYGLYEFTNYATLTNWPLPFVMVDILWGSVWSGLTALCAVSLLKMFD